MTILRIPHTCAASALLAAARLTTGEAESPPVSAGAAFVDHAAMRDWHADGDRGAEWRSAADPCRAGASEVVTALPSGPQVNLYAR